MGTTNIHYDFNAKTDKEKISDLEQANAQLLEMNARQAEKIAELKSQVNEMMPREAVKQKHWDCEY